MLSVRDAFVFRRRIAPACTGMGRVFVYASVHLLGLSRNSRRDGMRALVLGDDRNVAYT